MAYDANKILRAKVFWYSFKLMGCSLKMALTDTCEIMAALDNKHVLDPMQSRLLLHSTARQFSDQELANAVALYERVANGKYSLDLVNAILSIKEKEE